MQFITIIGLLAVPKINYISYRLVKVRINKNKVLDIESYNENKVNLGTDITEYIIEGGNHAGFADYGEQSGDGQLEINDQIEITYEQIYSFINNN